MTRETKIGLLVGLAFIIVIGILLSDHLTQTNEPQQAELAQVAGNVRSGVAVPGANQAARLGSAAAPPTRSVAPQQTVLTKEELAPAKPPVEIVQIGGASQQASSAKPPSQTETSAAPNSEQLAARPAEPVSGALANVARTMGEEIVPVDHSASRMDTAAARPPGTSQRQYKAEPGDSVSKMAAKVLGANTRSNRDAIIAANPSLQQNANMVIVGRTYIIPAAGSAPTPASPTPVAAQKPASSEAQYFYMVKPGDSLTRIAIEQLGNAAAVPAIMDLNSDVLKGRDVIRPNMKLRLPSKPVRQG